MSVAADVDVRQGEGKSRPGEGKAGIASTSDRDRLTLREREFIGACCTNGFKPTEACRQLGFGGKYPHVMATRMLKRPHVKAEFERRSKRMELKVEITIDKIAQRYAELAFAQHDGPLTASNVIQALDALGKWRGMFKPDQAVVIPVTFQFIGGPDPSLGSIIDQPSQPQPSPSAGVVSVPALGKPERG